MIDRAEIITRKEWSLLQKSGSFGVAYVEDSVDDETVKTESWEQHLRRTFHFMLPSLKKDSEAATKFFEIQELIKKTAIEKALHRKEAIIAQHPELFIPANIPVQFIADNTKTARKRAPAESKAGKKKLGRKHK